jgi:hypothetical protein
MVLLFVPVWKAAKRSYYALSLGLQVCGHGIPGDPPYFSRDRRRMTVWQGFLLMVVSEHQALAA